MNVIMPNVAFEVSRNLACPYLFKPMPPLSPNHWLAPPIADLLSKFSHLECSLASQPKPFKTHFKPCLPFGLPPR